MGLKTNFSKKIFTFMILNIFILLILRTHSKFKRTLSKNVVLITVGRIVDDGFILMKSEGMKYSLKAIFTKID